MPRKRKNIYIRKLRKIILKIEVEAVHGLLGILSNWVLWELEGGHGLKECGIISAAV